MQAHIFQHVPFEGPGSIADWLQAQGATTHYTHFQVDAGAALSGGSWTFW
jgi:hypothetical protein